MFRKHPLTEEFPDFEVKIHDLKVGNEYFKKLFDQYDEVDYEIYCIESDATPASNKRANQLRISRLWLKDELYHMLQEN